MDGRCVMARSAADGSDGNGIGVLLQSDVVEDLAAMGFASPVTKEQAGRRYHKDLARQVRASDSEHGRKVATAEG